ncbi:hypothetical protein EDB89DRAFT_780964 [Lactarius sanguifluus]|nr:hypothetical protein EDB89DRAFT_780964 [Lactarius sanguifluus]
MSWTCGYYCTQRSRLSIAYVSYLSIACSRATFTGGIPYTLAMPTSVQLFLVAFFAFLGILFAPQFQIDTCYLLDNSPRLSAVLARVGVGLDCGVASVRVPRVLLTPMVERLSLNDQLDISEMSQQRLEVGKVLAALSVINTDKSQQVLHAVQRYDDQARETIHSLIRLSVSAKLSIEYISTNLQRIVGVISDVQGEKSLYIKQKLLKSIQSRIDILVEDIQHDLRRLHGKASESYSNLVGCDDLANKIFITTGNAEKEQEDILKRTGEFEDWLKGILGTRVRPPALKAVSHLGTLMRHADDAKGVVHKLEAQVVEFMEGIEAAYRHPDKMVAVDIALEEQLAIVVDMLSKLGQTTLT